MSEESAVAESEVLRVESKCAECGEQAQVVELVLPGAKHPKAGATERSDLGVYDGIAHGEGGTLITAGVNGKCAWAIDESQLERLRRAFQHGDIMEVARVDSEFVPSYCVACNAHYCNAHWLKFPVFDDGFYDYSVGFCPKNHRVKLDD